MKKQLLFVICWLCIGIGSVFAQYNWTSGTIYLENGETYQGLVNLPYGIQGVRLGSNKVKFKISEDSKKKKFKEKEIQKVVLIKENGEQAEFRLMPVNSKRKALFEIIVDGETKLYARKVVSSGPGVPTGIHGESHISLDFWGEYNEILVLKPNAKSPENLFVTNVLKSFKKYAMEYFSDCLELVQKLENKVYRKDDIEQIVMDYNNCGD